MDLFACRLLERIFNTMGPLIIRVTFSVLLL